VLGADLFGDEGLHAAAGATLTLAKTAPGHRCAMAEALLAGLEGRVALGENDLDRALAAAEAFEAPLRGLSAARRVKGGASRLLLADQRAARVELLLACAARLKDRALTEVALNEAKEAEAGLDPDFEPLAWSRLESLRGRPWCSWASWTARSTTSPTGSRPWPGAGAGHRRPQPDGLGPRPGRPGRRPAGHGRGHHLGALLRAGGHLLRPRLAHPQDPAGPGPARRGRQQPRPQPGPLRRADRRPGRAGRRRNGLQVRAGRPRARAIPPPGP
jgi:hypothetical protein